MNEDVFRKVKARVGKRAKAQANETDVSFRKAGLHVAEQRRVASSKAGVSTDRGLTILELAQQLKHPASAMRVSSLKGFQNLLVDRKAADCEEMVCSYIGPASLVDISATVREEGFALLQKLQFTSFSTELVLSALNSLDSRQAIHAANVLEWLLRTKRTLKGGLLLESNLIPSLTRLLAPSANRSGKSGGILSSSKHESTDYDAPEKSKKRKMEAVNDDRVIVLKAIRSILVCSVGNTLEKKNDNKRNVIVLRDMSVWSEFATDQAQLHDSIQEELEQLLTKLRDVLLEENMNDFGVAADCFRLSLDCLAVCDTDAINTLCQQVTKTAYNNSSTLLLLALAQCGKNDTIMKAVIREACIPSTDNETFLIVADSVLKKSGDLTEQLLTSMGDRFFASTTSAQDMRSKAHRQAVRLVCTRQKSLHTENYMMRLPAFLVAWAADFSEDSIICVDRMKKEVMMNSDGPIVEHWRSGLEKLFEPTCFESFSDSLQHRLICFVANIGNPTANMIKHWSSLIAQSEAGENYMPLMIQCLHNIRHQMSVRDYLGFLIDSTGVFSTEDSGSQEQMDEKMEEICWAMRQIGVSKVLPKLVGVIYKLLDNDKTRSLATMLQCLAIDLNNGESIVSVLPENVLDRISKEFCRALTKSDEDREAQLPIFEFLRHDVIVLGCFIQSLPSKQAGSANEDHASLLDIVYDQLILPLHDRLPGQLISAFQNKSEPSSVLWQKVARLEKLTVKLSNGQM